MATQQARTDRARTMLITATVALVAERGVDGFSLADVGVRAGVSRGLPGHHFKSRDQLVSAAFAAVLAPPGLPSGQAGLAPLLTSLRRSAARASSPRVGALVSALTTPADRFDLAARVEAYLAGAEALMAAHLEAGMASGTVREDLDPAAASASIVAALLGLAVVAGRRPATLALQVDALIGAVRRAIASPAFQSEDQTAMRSEKATASSRQVELGVRQDDLFAGLDEDAAPAREAD
jgi:AcrR family transcriptional regulator